MKHHRLSIYPRKSSGNKVHLYVKYKFGRDIQKAVKTDLLIPESSWDNRRKEVKSNKEYLEYREKFRLLEQRRLELTDNLNSGLITVKEALERIPLWYVKDKDKTLLWYFENEYIPKKPKSYNPDRIYTIIGRIEFALNTVGKSDLVPITLMSFSSHTDDIANALFEVQTKNTATNYLQRINTILKKYDSSRFPDKFFEGYYQTEATEPKKPVEQKELLEAIPKINSYKRLEAFLFWMYSFCLRGLDGQDVTLVEDGMIEEKEVLDDYLFETENFDTPIHIELSRKKTRKRKFAIVVNAYPTLSILYLLKEVLKITRPEEVNEEDGLKLFKWDRVTDSRRWNRYADFLQGRLTTLFGKSFKSTRHTFTSSAERLRISVTDQTALIGNVDRKGSIKHYSKVDETRLDIQHLAVIDTYQIIRIYFRLLKHIKANEVFDIDPVRQIDRNLYLENRSKHLDDRWATIVDRLTELQEDFDYDLQSDVFIGEL